VRRGLGEPACDFFFSSLSLFHLSFYSFQPVTGSDGLKRRGVSGAVQVALVVAVMAETGLDARDWASRWQLW
jgi:hypothetical protein